ncbi:MAG: hypothetical protein RLZZ165_56 [Bacteroidota bacterium]|jgi:hypothetical protein
MKGSNELLEVWEAIRREMRILRGRNRFRGNEEYLWNRKEIRIHDESRRGENTGGLFIVHVTSRPEDLWAERQPGSERRCVSDSGNDWKAWLGSIVDQCRGGQYMHTNSKTADYRSQEVAEFSEKAEI